jgi:hypothetical protein
MRVRQLSYLLLLLGLVAVVGCASDTPTAANLSDDPDLATGPLQPQGQGFAIEFTAAGSSAAPVSGPFVLYGDSLRYVAELGALAVDLRVENRSRSAYPEPVALTFTRLLPDSVRVRDADNGVEGPGAAIVFGFANDDGMWTPLETSLPRTVHFAVGEGIAVAFHARLDVGSDARPGSIAGLVWDDRDGDGIVGRGEPGLEGVVVNLVDPDNPFEDGDGPAENLRFAVTGADGRYRIGDLEAGFYTLRVVLPPAYEPTTPTAVHVVLVARDGAVSSFLDADFGLRSGGEPVMVLEAVADATVRADLPARANDNYGCDPVVAVGNGRDGQPDLIRGLVRFELPVFIRAVEVRRARLVAEIERFRDGVGQIYDLAINAVVPTDSLTPWIEGNGSEQLDVGPGCEWVDPAFGVAWVGAGDGGDDNNQTQPDFRAEPAAVTRVVQDAMGPSALVEWDVTELVRAWHSGRLPNLGVFIRDIPGPDLPIAPEDFHSLWFVSREGEAAGLGRGLRLLVEYVDPAGAAD